MLHRKRSMTQRASGRERVSWERARVSAAVRERKPMDKRLVFIGLCLLVCLGSFELGARLAQRAGCGNNKNAQKVRIRRKDGLALLPLWVKNSQ